LVTSANIKRAHAPGTRRAAEHPSREPRAPDPLRREAIREAIGGSQPPTRGVATRAATDFACMPSYLSSSASPHELRPTLHACLVISRHQGHSVTISHTYRDRLGMDHHKLLGEAGGSYLRRYSAASSALRGFGLSRCMLASVARSPTCGR
jgi:hypothetical protein